MSDMYDVVAIGNATIDLMLGIHDLSKHARLNIPQKELCVTYGEKIPLDTYSVLVGGDACNVSVGLSRMGFSSALCAEIGGDIFAQNIIATLEKEQVSKEFLMQTEGAASSLAIGINFQKERTLFVEHVKRNHHFALDSIHTKWMYLASLGVEWEETYKQVLMTTKMHKVKLAFNIGALQLEKPSDIITDLLAVTEILFVNREEAGKILHKTTMLDVNELLTLLQKCGPKIIVLTDGEHGSHVIDSLGAVHFTAARPVTVVEKTGAGDAYASGFLSAVFSEKSIPEAMQWGTVNSASVIGKNGAQAGLLTRKALQAQL